MEFIMKYWQQSYDFVNEKGERINGTGGRVLIGVGASPDNISRTYICKASLNEAPPIDTPCGFRYDRYGRIVDIVLLGEDE